MSTCIHNRTQPLYCVGMARCLHKLTQRSSCSTKLPTTKLCNHYQKFLVLQLTFAIKIQLHATHATTILCSCIRQIAHDIQLHATHATTILCSCIKQVAHDIQLHATLSIQHVYIMLIYMFIHTYQSKCSYTLYATLFATTI